MENPVKEGFRFGKAHLFAFILMVLLVVILVVAYEARRPGSIAAQVARIPFLGRRIIGAAPPTPATKAV